jgi:hypothetical protein
MAAVSFKEYSLQDANTLEATQLGLEAGVIDQWPLNDQEVLVRKLPPGHGRLGAATTSARRRRGDGDGDASE